jgi:hypothetical protein
MYVTGGMKVDSVDLTGGGENLSAVQDTRSWRVLWSASSLGDAFQEDDKFSMIDECIELPTEKSSVEKMSHLRRILQLDH